MVAIHKLSNQWMTPYMLTISFIQNFTRLAMMSCCMQIWVIYNLICAITKILVINVACNQKIFVETNCNFEFFFNVYYHDKCFASQPTKLKHKEYFPLLESSLHFWRCLQTNNLNKLIFVNKNWPFNPSIGCLEPSNLTKKLCDIKSNFMEQVDVKFVDKMECENVLNFMLHFVRFF